MTMASQDTDTHESDAEALRNQGTVGQSPSDVVFELREICKQFGTEPAVHALIDVDLAVQRGQWLAITGPSGAGKSTLLNVLGCLDCPTSGRFEFEGVEVTTLTDRQRAGLRSRQIGFVFQSFHLRPYRTVLENVMLAEVYRRQSRSGRRERALAAIERVGLSHRADFLPTKLSGGERQTRSDCPGSDGLAQSAAV